METQGKVAEDLGSFPNFVLEKRSARYGEGEEAEGVELVVNQPLILVTDGFTPTKALEAKNELVVNQLVRVLLAHELLDPGVQDTGQKT